VAWFYEIRDSNQLVVATGRDFDTNGAAMTAGKFTQVCESCGHRFCKVCKGGRTVYVVFYTRVTESPNPACKGGAPVNLRCKATTSQGRFNGSLQIHIF
jgi:hypothetical protein